MWSIVNVFGLLLLYKTGLSTIAQEALSTYLNHCVCIELWLLYKPGLSIITQEVLSMALGAK